MIRIPITRVTKLQRRAVAQAEALIEQQRNELAALIAAQREELDLEYRHKFVRRPRKSYGRFYE